MTKNILRELNHRIIIFKIGELYQNKLYQNICKLYGFLQNMAKKIFGRVNIIQKYLNACMFLMFIFIQFIKLLQCRIKDLQIRFDQEMWRITARLYFSVQKFDPKKDYYKLLQLKQNATKDQIKKSFRQFAKRYHPDSKSGNEALFKQINEAHQILSSDELKKQYDQSRKSQTAHASSQQEKRQSPYQRQYYEQGRMHQDRQKPPQYQYDEQNPEKFREYMRKKHEEDMKRYTQQRHNYDNLGRAYQNYQKFRQETLKKKKQQYEQKVKITQQSVKRQQQVYRKFSEQKEQQYRDKMKQDIKKDLLNRYNKAIDNSQKTIEGIKGMYNIFKDLFKKK